MIHLTAIVEAGAQIGAGSEIHPYAIVRKGSVLGERVTVHPFAVVGGDSQDLKFNPAVASGIRIGAGTCVRENVTINRSNLSGTCTEVGRDCLLMAACHIAHDCIVGDRVVVGNAALLAGHVEVGDDVILGGATGLHQFIRVGEGAMIGGGAIVTLDIPPFVLVSGRNQIIGLNPISLRRRSLSRATVRELKQAFRAVYFAMGNILELAAAALASGKYATPEARSFLGFFARTRRGFARVRGVDFRGKRDSG